MTGWTMTIRYRLAISKIERHWCSGNIGASQALAPGSIPGWRIFSSCGAVGSASVLCADGPGFEPLHEHFCQSRLINPPVPQ